MTWLGVVLLLAVIVGILWRRRKRPDEAVTLTIVPGTPVEQGRGDADDSD